RRLSAADVGLRRRRLGLGRGRRFGVVLNHGLRLTVLHRLGGFWFVAATCPASLGTRRGIARPFDLQTDELRTHRHHFTHFAAQRLYRAVDRRRHLHRGLVGHDIGQHLVFNDGIAWLDMPFNQFDLGNAFADIRHFYNVYTHAYFPPWSAAGTASGFMTRLQASATRAGLGKYAHSWACG